MINGKPLLRVLVIEDDQDDVMLVVRVLRDEWRVVWHRVDNEAGLLIALEKTWDVILCDVSLPQFSAERALLVAREHFSLHDATLPPFIVISGTADENEGVNLLIKGARDFVPKSVVTTKEQHMRLILAVKRELRQSGELLAKELEITEAYDAVIAAWGKALEFRDMYTHGHTERVTTCALRLAINLNLERNQFVALNRGAFLHDIGKIRIPDAILLKRDHLTIEEMEIMKQHPIYAYEMLKDIPFLREASVVPLYHHERWNGTGYPTGKMGKDIPFLARLFAVCDVYDALTSDRPYRQSWDKSQAVAYLLEEAGRTFDPEIVKEFVDMVGRG